jgi:hypothetical protein
MRVAVCLSGQPRFLKECYDGLYNNLIKSNNADVFMHAWSAEDALSEPYKFGGDGDWKNKRLDPGAHNLAVEMYQPKSYYFEKQVEFSDKRIDFLPTVKKYMPGAIEKKEYEEAGMTTEQYANRLLRNIMSMWYSRKQVNLLKENHEVQNSFKYDYVISTRYDMYLHHPIVCSQLDPRIVYYPDLGHPVDLIADWIGIGNSDWMNIYSNVFSNIFYHYNWFKDRGDSAICSERMLYNQLKIFGIPTHRIKMNIGLPRF